LGGDGGNGAVTTTRENYGVTQPDGGCGGQGGSVYFEATEKLNSLFDLRRAHFKGNPGKHGKG
jgi:GTPase